MTGRWLGTAVDRSDAPIRLFCFAHAGGGPSFFHSWRPLLRPDVEVCPVLLPGRESRYRERPYTRMTALIGPLVEGLRPYADRPYGLFGHSLGALVAFEVARRLCAEPADGPLLRLLVSGRRAPQLPPRRPDVAGAPREHFLDIVTRLGGMPEQMLRQPDLLDVWLPVMRADFSINETYTPQDGPRLPCPVSAYTGDDDPEVTPAEMRAWREVTDTAFRLRVFSGGHFYLAEALEDLLGDIRTELTDALPARTAPATARPAVRRDPLYDGIG